jgi:hypothetical protein
MQSSAKTAEAYLAELPEDRRAALTTVRQVILDNLPTGYEEGMNYGMICYFVPFEVYPDTYNGQPMMYAALASQKNYMSLYLTTIYASDTAASRFDDAYRATGKRLDRGKSCVRFRKLDDLPLPLVGETIAAVSMEDFVKFVDGAMAVRMQRKA